MEKNFDIISNGLSIKCRLYYTELKNIEKIILSCHGFAGSKDNSFSKKLANDYYKINPEIGVLVFDWPCHGNDVRQTLNLNMCDQYLSAVINYIQNNLRITELYAQGTSFGGYLILKYLLEHENPFKKIALRCPAINMYDVLTRSILSEDEFTRIMKEKIVQTGFSRKIKISKQLLSELHENNISTADFSDFSDILIIIQGTQDEIVSFDYVSKFADDNIIEFYPVEGADHTYKDPSKMRYCLDLIENFFSIELSKTKKR